MCTRSYLHSLSHLLLAPACPCHPVFHAPRARCEPEPDVYEPRKGAEGSQQRHRTLKHADFALPLAKLKHAERLIEDKIAHHIEAEPEEELVQIGGLLSLGVRLEAVVKLVKDGFNAVRVLNKRYAAFST